MLWELLWSFFQIGLFSIGGGYAAMPLIRGQVVDLNAWLTMEQFTDLITIAEMTPGPIAINAATFVGTQIAGLPGALIATLGCVLPSCLIVSGLAFLYRKFRNLSLIQGILNGLRPAVVALIASAGLSILLTALWSSGQSTRWLENLRPISCALFALALLILRRKKPSPILVMAGCGAVGILLYLLGVPV